MLAAVLTAPGRPDPFSLTALAAQRPGEGEVLVEVAACGVCGHDQADRAGLLKIELPVVLGHEIAGTVVDIGAGVDRFTVGDRVACKQFRTCGHCTECSSGNELRCAQRQFVYGGFADYTVIHQSALLRVPADVPLHEAAVVACAVGTGLQALDRIAKLRTGETVLVTGAGGGLGLHAVQVAAALGARVIAFTGDRNKTARLKAAGADHVTITGAGAWSEVHEVTDGHGADVVLDNTGHPGIFHQAFRALAHSGRYVLTGQVTGRPISIHPAHVFAKEAVVTGSGSTSMSTFTDAMRMVADGRIRPVVATYPLSAIDHAFADLDRHAVTGRAVVTPKSADSPRKDRP